MKRAGLRITWFFAGVAATWAGSSLAASTLMDGLWRFATGDAISAEEVNVNFRELATRIENLRRTRESMYVEQTAELLTSGDGNWADIPGLEVMFTTTAASTTVEMFTVLEVTGQPGPTRCDVRYTVDASPLGSGEASVGVNQLYTAPVDTNQLSALRRVTVPAGPHRIRAQGSKAAGIYANTNCRFWANGRMRVEMF
jgi:hypothetical protein